MKRDYWDIALQRLNANTTTEANVKSHLLSKQVEVREVHLYPSKRKGCVTARVRVALKDKALALDSCSFGPFIQVSSWTLKTKSVQKPSTSGVKTGSQNGES